jgi:hypothetical protein
MSFVPLGTFGQLGRCFGRPRPRMKKPPEVSGGNVRMSELQQPKRREYRRAARQRQGVSSPGRGAARDRGAGRAPNPLRPAALRVQDA